MDLFPETVSKEYIVLRTRESVLPEEMTDGQLLAHLHQAQKETAGLGDDTMTPAHDRLTRLLEEARRRCLTAAL